MFCKTNKLYFTLNNINILDDISISIANSKSTAIFGKNGSGKSTTVKMLLGLLYPSRGRINVFGHSPRHVQTKSRLGYLPEES